MKVDWPGHWHCWHAAGVGVTQGERRGSDVTGVVSLTVI